MQTLIRHVGAAAAALALMTPLAGHAADIVVPGSTYSFAIQGRVPNPAYPADRSAPPELDALRIEANGVRFDGLTDAFDNATNEVFVLDDTRASPKAVTLSESQTDLGGGRFRIAFTFRVTNGNLFPHTTEAFYETIGVNLGNDPLDIVGSAALHVDAAVLSMNWIGGGSFGYDWATFTPYPFATPWGGQFMNARGGAGFTGVGYIVVDQVDLAITVSRIDAPVTEPAPLALTCLAGVALAGARRQRALREAPRRVAADGTRAALPAKAG